MTESKQKTVYCYSAATGEYAGETTAQRSPLDLDEVYLIPAWSAEDAPPTAGARHAAAFRAGDGSVPRHCAGGDWCVLPDWRGVPLWSTSTAQRIAAALGDTPASLGATELEPPQFGVWNGRGWVVDAAALQAAQKISAEAEVAFRRSQADAAVVPLQDAADLGIATVAETALLTAWRRYRVLLSRVPQQPGFPGEITWPAAPSV
ncbi:tail fiber assembly protein [Chromobacterium violaceum]|uniref:tail fiber assembly protein n=1 Tax=Chromobacterium violaceum TaxID=536 RepID=UPI0019510883|nr:tail fiber assembly protein [Chromobacterium violaceum]QRO34117.1 tail fiber assembly protein [Chromobacterium violaceum]QRQ16080.1 tail fiber assembly protein [Chromobacterium violaceum]